MTYLPFSRYKAGVALNIWIQPSSSKRKVVGLQAGRVKIKLESPPVANQANQECIKYLSTLFEIPKSKISIISGQHSRQKTVYLTGITPSFVQQVLGQCGFNL